MAYKTGFGRGRKDLIGTTLKELLGPLYEMDLPHFEAAYRGERQVFERAVPRPDGSGARHRLATYIPRIVDENRLRARRRCRPHQATRIGARRQGRGRQARGPRLPDRPSQPAPSRGPDPRPETGGANRDKVFLLGIDVDRFKDINDSYGHAAGDRSLIEIAARVRSCLRDYDTLARIGGDEFLVLTAGAMLPDGIESPAARILESARAAVHIDAAEVTLTVSIGIAEFARDGTTLEALMLSARRALYAAKNAGRNRFASCAGLEAADGLARLPAPPAKAP